MNNSLHKMEYTEFIQCLKTNSIKYMENKYQGFLCDMVEVIPLSENYASRKFDEKDGKQEKRERDLRKRTILDFMNYDQYIIYLNNSKVKYEEWKSWDLLMLDYIEITPVSKKLKTRYFCAELDKGIQVFDDEYREL